jgi:hypothetical protein
VTNPRDQTTCQQGNGRAFEPFCDLSVPPLAGKLRILLEKGSGQRRPSVRSRRGTYATGDKAPGGVCGGWGGQDNVVAELLAHSASVHQAHLRVVGRKTLLLLDGKRHVVVRKWFVARTGTKGPGWGRQQEPGDHGWHRGPGAWRWGFSPWC